MSTSNTATSTRSTSSFSTSDGSQKGPAALFEESKEVLEDPNLWQRIRAKMKSLGLAGDTLPSELAYISLTSRSLERPLNLSIVGDSSGGKSQKLKYALKLQPSEAYHKTDAASEKAFIYDSEPLKHRILVFSEADSLPDSGHSSSALRALIHDSEMVYKVTEKSTDGKFKTRTVIKEGPTGLITTGTKSLGYQLRTRVIEIDLRQSEEDNREVLRTLARSGRAVEQADDEEELAQLIAMQQWLASEDSVKNVVVPFAEELSEHLPATSPEIFRKFEMLMSCIETFAFMYQKQRQRNLDDDGAVIATLEDYRYAKELLDPVFTACALEGVSEGTREIVQAVGDDTLSVTEIAGRLGIGKSAASPRINRAIEDGWLVNKEWKKGCPAQIQKGDPLPDSGHVLPEPEVFGCSDCSAGSQEETKDRKVEELPPDALEALLQLYDERELYA